VYCILWNLLGTLVVTLNTLQDVFDHLEPTMYIEHEVNVYFVYKCTFALHSHSYHNFPLKLLTPPGKLWLKFTKLFSQSTLGTGHYSLFEFWPIPYYQAGIIMVKVRQWKSETREGPLHTRVFMCTSPPRIQSQLKKCMEHMPEDV